MQLKHNHSVAYLYVKLTTVNYAKNVGQAYPTVHGSCITLQDASSEQKPSRYKLESQTKS